MEDEKRQEKNEVKNFSRGKQKKLKKKKTQAKIGEAESLIFQVLKNSAEWKQEKCKHFPLEVLMIISEKFIMLANKASFSRSNNC